MGLRSLKMPEQYYLTKDLLDTLDNLNLNKPKLYRYYDEPFYKIVTWWPIDKTDAGMGAAYIEVSSNDISKIETKIRDLLSQWLSDTLETDITYYEV